MTSSERPTRFSAALQLPFTPRTWPSRATAEASSRTAPWRLATDADTGSSGEVQARRTPSFRTRAPAPLPPPPPPPRRRGTGSGERTMPPIDPQRLANLFSYRLADDAAIAERKLSVLQGVYTEMAAAADAAETAVIETIRSEKRHYLIPFSEKLTALADVKAFHHRCLTLSRDLALFEEVVVQSLVRDSSARVTSETGGADDRRVRSVLHAARSFVELEMALRALATPPQPDADGASVVEPAAALLSLVRERWQAVQAQLPVDEAHYYDVVDLINTYGPEWTQAAAFATQADTYEVGDEGKAVDAAAARLDSSIVLAKLHRVLQAQRSSLQSKAWMSFDALCNVVGGP